eukprot:gnl/MRDRNA2_/MRDRNA2_126640_c0_seq1.p1 gnl/MRDRNA2_/MRDRNA2_126640_c0~~gnl/MRDRNA2_/MRDRNA2_126640_c0_seq1.p1  ORF type:complete len:278 (+),score=15.07 gnl/MRDRNA2_/MRDRNA2_126640_c0_seq1:69-902(+)
MNLLLEPLSSLLDALWKHMERQETYGCCWGKAIAEHFIIERRLTDGCPSIKLRLTSDLVCPITQETIKDAVLTVDGGIYSADGITRWIHHKRGMGQPVTSPLTGLVLPSNSVIPLRALIATIETFLTRKHGELSTSQVFTCNRCTNGQQQWAPRSFVVEWLVALSLCAAAWSLYNNASSPWHYACVWSLAMAIAFFHYGVLELLVSAASKSWFVLSRYTNASCEPILMTVVKTGKWISHTGTSLPAAVWSMCFRSVRNGSMDACHFQVNNSTNVCFV